MTNHIGLIGSGNISQTHARAARAIPGVQVSAIYGTNPQSVARLAAEHHAKPFTDFAAFLAHKPLDLGILGSPSGLHAEQGIAAAQRGLHVLTEKPMDISTKKADALIAAADKANVKLAVIFQDRLKPNIKRLKHWLDLGLLGKPLLADARVKWYRPPDYYSNYKWRGTFALDGGGALINQAIHTVDLLLWLLGDVLRVHARTATVLHKIEAEDTAVATLEFASGAVGTLLAITAADLRNPPPDFANMSTGDSNQSASSAAVTDISGHQAILEDFLHAIANNTQPICNGRQGRRSLALVESIYTSARTFAL